MRAPRSLLRLKSFCKRILSHRRKGPCHPTSPAQLDVVAQKNTDPPPLQDSLPSGEADFVTPAEKSPPAIIEDGARPTIQTSVVEVADDLDAQFRIAVSLSDEDTEKPSKLKLCAAAFLQRFRDSKEIKDMSQAITAYTLALNYLPEESVGYYQCQKDTANALLQRFRETAELHDIDNAILHLQKLASGLPDDHSAKSGRLNALGIAQVKRFEHTGNIADLNDAILNQTNAVTLGGDTADSIYWLNDLGVTLCSRFRVLGNMSDVVDAISDHEKALRLSLTLDPTLTPTCHNNLGNSLYHRFKHSGNLSDISDAIVHGQQSVNLTLEGDESLAGRLNNLAISYMERFNVKKDVNDLSDAIACQERVVNLKSGRFTSTEQTFSLNNLGTMYKQKFQMTGDLQDISTAIRQQSQALQQTPESHIHYSTILANLSHSYQARFRQSGDLDDILKAVSYAEKAVLLTPHNHSGDLAARLNGLGNAYSRLFERTNKEDDLKKAIECHERTVQLVPEGHADRCQWLSNLGKAYLRRHKHTKDESDMQLALAQYKSSSAVISGSPTERLASAEIWARLSRLANAEESLHAYGVAVNLISRVAGLDQTMAQRHTSLLNISSLTREAAAVAFSRKEYTTALEWLEQGRCLVWNQLNQLRTPMDKLYAQNAALATRLTTVSQALEHLGSTSKDNTARENILEAGTLETTIAMEKQSNEHIKLAQEWESLVTQIREMPEFEDFLQPRKAHDILKCLPKYGYVILVNVHERRCDALILHSSGDPLHVPLPDFSYAKAEALRAELISSLKQNGVMQRGTFRLNAEGNGISSIRNVLSELWRCVALRITAYIHSIQPLTSRTRIWWCLTGPLAFLPLHAAGIYGEGTKKITSLPYFAVSSYIPTISYLVDNIHRPRPPSDKFLLISQPDTPNFAPIPGTQQEVFSLIESLKSRETFSYMHLDKSQATVDAVTQEIEQYPWVHVACHAVQDTSTPLQSGFHLYNGRLALGNLIKLNIPYADFAFLSACQTSTGDEKLSEEAVHLAGGMLAAGYRSIVSTMWSISDSQGPGIAKLFYQYLFEASVKLGLKGLSGAGAAYALDYAIKRTREEVTDTESGLLTWVPYVHFGV